MSERHLFEGIQRGDPTAEKKLYLQNKEKCVSFALKHFFWKMPDGAIQKCLAEDAEELYNDACAICIHNIVRGRISNLEVRFSTYLITSMRYAWFNKARSQKPKLERKDLPDNTPNPDKEGIRLNVRKAIANLDPKCKEMMTYRYILGWEDYEDVAKATGKNNGDVVRNLISRCRKRFRELYLQLTKLSGV